MDEDDVIHLASGSVGGDGFQDETGSGGFETGSKKLCSDGHFGVDIHEAQVHKKTGKSSWTVWNSFIQERGCGQKEA